jgi:hypothetical protein
MFSHRAYAQRPQQRGYSKLDALADDLEYRASLAREAARRLASVYGPASQHWNVSGSYQYHTSQRQHSSHRFHSQSMRQPYYEPVPYYGVQPQHYYDPEVQPPPHLYEPESEYEEYYGYEYPTEGRVARRPALYAPDDGFIRPKPAPLRGIAPHLHCALPPHREVRYVAEGRDEYDPRMEPRHKCECGYHAGRQDMDESPLSERVSVRGCQAELTEPEARRPAATLEDLVSLIVGSRQVSAQRNANPAHGISQPTATAGPERRDEQDILEQLLSPLTSEQRSAAHSGRVPAAPQRAAHAASDLEALLRLYLGGRKQAPAQQIPSVQDEPETPVYSLEDFLGQIAGIAAGHAQRPAQQGEQRAARYQQEVSPQSKPTVCVHLAHQGRTDSEADLAPKKQSQAQPKVRRSA